MKKVKIRSYLKKYWFFALIAPLFMIGEVLVDLKQPELMAHIVNTVVESGDVNIVLTEIVRTCLKMLGLVCCGGAMGILCCYAASIASQGFGNDLRVDSFNKVMSLSLQQTDKFTTGSLVTRLTNDISTLQEFVMMILRMFVRAPIFFVGGLYMCLKLDISFAGVVVIALPLILIIVMVMVIKAVPMFTVVQKKLDRVNSVVQESVSGARVIKAYTREEYEIGRFEEANSEYQATNIRVMIIMSCIWPLLSMVMNAAVIAIIYIGGWQVEASRIHVGDVMAAVQYITQVLGSIMMISMIFQQLARGNACAKRVREILEADEIISDGDTFESKEVGTIRFEHVSFRYPGSTGHDVLHDISFSVNKGETVALIGATGSGKTSLVNLIPRFYDATEGNVYVDGVNVKQWNLHALRKKIGFVLQKSELFSGTVNENISWGDSNASEEEIIAASKVAQADEFISQMENGYESLIAEKGASLSGGQKQRVSIARAALRKPEILIFDDSTSALDLATEAKLRRALASSFDDATIFMIAQRIASVMHADRIAVIENGTITDFDTHENLMKNSHTYQEIYHSQIKSEEGLEND